MTGTVLGAKGGAGAATMTGSVGASGAGRAGATCFFFVKNCLYFDCFFK